MDHVGLYSVGDKIPMGSFWGGAALWACAVFCWAVCVVVRVLTRSYAHEGAPLSLAANPSKTPRKSKGEILGKSA